MLRNGWRARQRRRRRRRLRVVIIATILGAVALVGMRACSQALNEQGTRAEYRLTVYMQA